MELLSILENTALVLQALFIAYWLLDAALDNYLGREESGAETS